MLKEAKELVINNNDDEVLTRSVLNRVYVDYFLNALIFKIGEEL